MMWGYGWGMSWFGWTLMILIWLVVVAGVIWLVRALAGPRGSAGGDAGGDSARRILDERFAAGEITPEDYEARRAALAGRRR